MWQESPSRQGLILRSGLQILRKTSPCDEHEDGHEPSHLVTPGNTWLYGPTFVPSTKMGVSRLSVVYMGTLSLERPPRESAVLAT